MLWVFHLLDKKVGTCIFFFIGGETEVQGSEVNLHKVTQLAFKPRLVQAQNPAVPTQCRQATACLHAQVVTGVFASPLRALLLQAYSAERHSQVASELGIPHRAGQRC